MTGTAAARWTAFLNELALLNMWTRKRGLLALVDDLVVINAAIIDDAAVKLAKRSLLQCAKCGNPVRLGQAKLVAMGIDRPITGYCDLCTASICDSRHHAVYPEHLKAGYVVTSKPIKTMRLHRELTWEPYIGPGMAKPTNLTVDRATMLGVRPELAWLVVIPPEEVRIVPRH